MSQCPSEIDLDRAYSVGPDHELTAHLAICESCRAWWNETDSAIELMRELPFQPPPARHREELRTSVLAATPRPPIARRRWIGPVAGLAAAAAVVLVIAHHQSPSAPVAIRANRGTVHAHAGAQFSLPADAPDEIVRLRDGTIDLDVQPLARGERFRVIVGADEIEVRGTSFEVNAAADHLVAVHVVHGRVEVRHIGSANAILGAGDSWHAPSLAVIAPPPPLPAPIAVAAPLVSRTPGPRRTQIKREAPVPAPMPPAEIKAPTDPQEIAFVAGWNAMRRNDFRTAVASFARAVALDPNGSLAEDGAFWHAVALARLARDAEAIAALRSFLDDYAQSTRAGEASAMLGWMLVDLGELDEARTRFEAAAHDPSASVQANARKGLAAVPAKTR